MTIGVVLGQKESTMRSKNSKTTAQRKAEGLRKLSQAYSDAIKAGTVRKVLTVAKP
uniref:Uncharacterized protein n=1 Tax=Aliivibrio wodanis TaxID=80852 RepID=A0A5Q4YZF6_9GAMM|nr:hypothetical protein AW0309160_01176 [Aliivibrio wodanis]